VDTPPFPLNTTFKYNSTMGRKIKVRNTGLAAEGFGMPGKL